MGRVVGIELTEAAVKLLLLEQNGKGARIVDFYEGPVPAGEQPWEERATQAVRDAFAGSKMPRTGVVASIDSGDAILREVSLPFKDPDQIRKTVRFEMESQIHNYTIEQLIVAHYKTGETDKGSLLLAAAVPKAVIEKRLKVLEGAGVDPSAIDLDACALFNALRYAGAIETDEPQLLVYGTTKFTKLVFVEQKQPRSIRTIRFSLPGEPVPEKPDHAAHEALVGILAKEISRFLLANAASASPAHILLSGDFEGAEAARRIEAATKIPVKTFDLLGKIENSFGGRAGEVASRVGVPLGLALKGAGVDALGMDFRQEEFSYRKKFEAIRTTALVTLQLVIVLLAAVALHLYFKREDLRAATGKVRADQQELYQDATGQPCPDPNAAFDLLKEAIGKIQGGAGSPLERSAREAWRDLFRALDAFQRKYANQKLGEGDLFVELEGLDIRQNTTPGNESFELQIRGKVRNLEFAQALKNEIRTAGEQFKEAEYQGPIVPIPGEELFRFQMRAYKGKRGS